MSRAAASRAATPPGTLEGALLFPVLLLAGFGLVMSHSATAHLAPPGALPPPFVRHAGALALAAALAVLVARLPLHLWRGLALPFWAVSIVLLGLTAAFGVEVNGARRWLAVPGLGVRFQPGELAKLATLLAVAAVLARGDGQPPRSPSRLWAPTLLAAVPAGLLLLQPDLGNTVMLLLLVGALLFAAGAPLRLFVAPGLLGAAGVAAYVAAVPYAWRRLVGFLDPWGRSDAEGYHLVQSFVAFARGGLAGVGLGDGRQKLFYLPYAHTDFILSVVAEELGLVGVLLVLGAFVALAFAGVRVARAARGRFALLVGFGATALLALPALLNTAVVAGMVPTKGLPLPFLSYGRTALVVCGISAGLLLAAARQASGPERRS